jgi:hypothetical protein
MKEVRSLRRRLAFLVDATKDLQRRNDVVMAGREDENTPRGRIVRRCE